MVTTTFQLTREEEILDQIQKSASLSEAEKELDKEAGIRNFFGKKLGKFVGGMGKNWFKAIKPGAVISPNSFKGGYLKGMGFGKKTHEVVSTLPENVSGFLPHVEKSIGKDVLGKGIGQLGAHGQGKSLAKPWTYGQGQMGDAGKGVQDILSGARKKYGNKAVEEMLSKRTTQMAGKGVGSVEALRHQQKGIKRATGMSLSPAAPAARGAAPAARGAAPTAPAVTPATPTPNPAAAPKTGTKTKTKVPPPPDAAQSSIGNSWKDWKEKGWSGLTEQQRRTLTIYGAGGFLLKDPAFNALGVNNNRN